MMMIIIIIGIITLTTTIIMIIIKQLDIGWDRGLNDINLYHTTSASTNPNINNY